MLDFIYLFFFLNKWKFWRWATTWIIFRFMKVHVCCWFGFAHAYSILTNCLEFRLRNSIQSFITWRSCKFCRTIESGTHFSEPYGRPSGGLKGSKYRDSSQNSLLFQKWKSQWISKCVLCIYTTEFRVVLLKLDVVQFA